MSILLYLPGLLVILFKRGGVLFTFRQMSTIVLSQALFALPFLQEDPWAYLHSSFEFSRVFLYKWTVNWRILGEQAFLSPHWAKSLLIGHASTLIAFGLYRWCRNDGNVWAVLKRGFRQPTLPGGLFPVTADCESVPISLLITTYLERS